jgi:hypothetical protein
MSPGADVRLPWWLAGVVAAFAIYFALLISADLRRPEAIGFTLVVDGRGIVVATVGAGSPAAAAGLKAGDRVIAANGRPTRTRHDWLAFNAHLTAPGVVALDIARDTRIVKTTLRLKRVGTSFWTTLAGATLGIARAVQLVTLLLAILVVWRRPDDRTAVIGAWLLGSIAVFSISLPYGFAASWQGLPTVVTLLLALPLASSLAIGPIMLTFLARFPRPLLHSPLAYGAIWLPALPMLLLQLATVRALAYETTPPVIPGSWNSLLTLTPALYAIAAVVGIALAHYHETDLTARRRIRVVEFGSVIGLLGMAPIVITQAQGDPVLNSSVFATHAIAFGTLIGLAWPASFAYAILRHRLFDVSFIVRRSIQYALAKGVLLSIVPLAAAMFLLDLLMNRQVPIGDILQARGWLYAGVALFAAVARVRRQAWLDALDRKFFRERYNAQRLLRSIAEDVEHTPAIAAAAPRVVAQIEAALHPTVAALMMRGDSRQSYECVSAAPPGVSVGAVAADSTLGAVLPLLRRPLRISARRDDTFVRQVTPAELNWVRDHGIELIVPVRSGAGGHEAFFALGPRRSEEPYSMEDEDLLATVGHALAQRTRRDAAAGFEECPVCGFCFAPGTTACAHDGSALVHTALPQVLDNRYSLTRRIGRGGMGTVYVAGDGALGRSVAVKVLREDLTDPAAARRFRAEAQRAAALGHPNVVTVYDIGVNPFGRAFFVMELLEGQPLDEELRRAGRFEPARALHLFKGICAAVRAAHAHRIVHRDLKPQNIFLCAGEDVETAKVLDFGLAKALEVTRMTALTRPGIVLGTPRYMSPEQLRGEETSVDGDLWALALIALEMLIGSEALEQPPGVLPRLDHLPLSPSLRHVFARALAPDPLDRPASVDELLNSLERALSEPQEAEPGHRARATNGHV